MYQTHTTSAPILLRALPTLVALIITLGSLFSPGALSAQSRGRGVEVWAEESIALEAVPGQIYSLSFMVESQSVRTSSFEEILDLPKGWQPILPASQISLKLGEPQVRLVSFAIPGGAPAGRYEIAYYLQGRNDPDIVDWESITVIVQPVVDFHMEVTSTPSFVVAGDKARATLEVQNDGNTPQTLTFESPNPGDIKVKFEPASLTLFPNERGEVVVHLETDGGSKRSEQHVLKILGLPEASKDSTQTTEPARTILTVETVPRSKSRPERMRTMPSTLTVATYYEDDVFTPQLTWQGRGALNAKETRTLDFMLRGGDASKTAPLLGRRDEYWARYKGDALQVKAGDQTYRMSWMTEAAAYGRGAEVIADIGAASVGAFYVTPRFGAQTANKAAAFAGADAGEHLEFRVNGLYLMADPAQGDQGQAGVMSALTTLTLGESQVFSLELAGSQALDDTPAQEGRGGLGYRLEGEGQVGEELRYNVQALRSSPTFKGYFKDTDIKRGNIQYTLSDTYRLRTLVQSQVTNLGATSDLSGAHMNRTVDIAAQCLNQEGWCYDGGIRSSMFRDEIRFPGALGHEHIAQARAVKAGAPLRVDARANVGVREGLDGQGLGTVGGGQFIGTFNPNPGQTLSLIGRLQYNALEDDRLSDATRSIALRSYWSLGERLSLGGEYQLAGSQSLSQQAEFNGRVALPGQFNLQGTARYQSARPGQEARFAALVSLSRDLQVPVAPKRESGSVRGKLINPYAMGDVGLEGVILKMAGSTAITDSKGRFSFHGIAPGTYPIYVDNQSLGPEMLLTEGQGQEVEVMGARVSRVLMKAVKGAEVSGQIRLRGQGGETFQGANASYIQGAGLTGPISLDGIPVELRQGAVTIRRMTDSQGNFLFQGLNPGPFTLSIDSDYLPPHHVIEGHQGDLSLEAGEAAMVTFTLVPKRRDIRFLDDGIPAQVSQD